MTISCLGWVHLEGSPAHVWWLVLTVAWVPSRLCPPTTRAVSLGLGLPRSMAAAAKRQEQVEPN